MTQGMEYIVGFSFWYPIILGLPNCEYYSNIDDISAIKAIVPITCTDEEVDNYYNAEPKCQTADYLR